VALVNTLSLYILVAHLKKIGPGVVLKVIPKPTTLALPGNANYRINPRPTESEDQQSLF
jgi:hypothetical protein